MNMSELCLPDAATVFLSGAAESILPHKHVKERVQQNVIKQSDESEDPKGM